MKKAEFLDHSDPTSAAEFPKFQETSPDDRSTFLTQLNTFASYTTPEVKELLFHGRGGLNGTISPT